MRCLGPPGASNQLLTGYTIHFRREGMAVWTLPQVGDTPPHSPGTQQIITQEPRPHVSTFTKDGEIVRFLAKNKNSLPEK